VAHLIYKSSVISYIFFNNYPYIGCILVISQCDVGQNSDRKMLMNTNMWPNMYINVYLLAYHTSIRLLII